MIRALLTLAVVSFSMLVMGADSPSAKPAAEVVSTSLADLQPMVGKTVAEFLEAQRVTLKACQLVEEPPGVLSSLSFATPKAGERLVLFLKRTPGLFDRQGHWKPEAIRGATVVRIEIEKSAR